MRQETGYLEVPEEGLAGPFPVGCKEGGGGGGGICFTWGPWW
jgi:hypothetical protein